MAVATVAATATITFCNRFMASLLAFYLLDLPVEDRWTRDFAGFIATQLNPLLRRLSYPNSSDGPSERPMCSYGHA